MGSEKHLVIGLMSGTSVDAVDAAQQQAGDAAQQALDSAQAAAAEAQAQATQVAQQALVAFHLVNHFYLRGAIRNPSYRKSVLFQVHRLNLILSRNYR